MISYTKLTDVVMIGEYETTIAQEFELHRKSRQSPPISFRAYRGSGGGSPFDTYHVALSSKTGIVETFNVTEHDYKTLTG